MRQYLHGFAEQLMSRKCARPNISGLARRDFAQKLTLQRRDAISYSVNCEKPIFWTIWCIVQYLISPSLEQWVNIKLISVAERCVAMKGGNSSLCVYDYKATLSFCRYLCAYLARAAELYCRCAGVEHQFTWKEKYLTSILLWSL